MKSRMRGPTSSSAVLIFAAVELWLWRAIQKEEFGIHRG